jgi:hypothetical protein
MATRKQIVIEGDLVHLVVIETGKNRDRSGWEKKTTTGTIRLSDWLDTLEAEKGKTEFLPPIKYGHIVARKEKGNRSAVVVQLPPSVRSFYYSPEKRTYNVAYPYTYFVIQFIGEAVNAKSAGNKVGISFFYRNSPINSLDDEMLRSNMPNVFKEGKICWSRDTIDVSLPLATKVEKIIEAFWSSNFNHHEMGENWEPSTGIPGHPQSFAKWQEMTEIDPAFVLEISWRKTHKSVRELMEEWTNG